MDAGGAIANEMRSWLYHIATGKPCMLTTPRQAPNTLEATLAIQLAAESRKIVTLPLLG